jgi:hypothetical protein
MKSMSMKHYEIFLFVLLIGVLSIDVKAEEDLKEAMKADQTGTNPINFTYDLRFYNEYQWLNTKGDGHQHINTLEFRAPIKEGKWQFRTRVRGTGLSADLNGDGSDDIDKWGLGEVDFRFLTVTSLDMSKKQAWAFGFETFLPTAEDGLGSERLSFGPQIFFAQFNPLGLKGFLFAPGYQQKFSVYEESDNDPLNQGIIDLYVLWQSQDKQYWALLDPQIVIDYEESQEFVILDLEVGTMLDKYLNTKGHSAYVRPSLSIGVDRPSDYSIEVGYKIIW